MENPETLTEAVRRQKDSMRQRLADLEAFLPELHNASDILTIMLAESDAALSATLPDGHPLTPLYEIANTLSVRCPEKSTAALTAPSLAIIKYLLTRPDIKKRGKIPYGDKFDARRTLLNLQYRLLQLHKGIHNHEEVVHPFMDIVALLQTLAPEKTRAMAEALLDCAGKCIIQTETSIKNYKSLKL